MPLQSILTHLVPEVAVDGLFVNKIVLWSIMSDYTLSQEAVWADIRTRR